ncbi:cytoplasmic tRNA 2-thiolation protein 1 [Pneumocystis carinii B80]|uniref:Cytoplasmic tRNA 2-thiolation protein 1 n=1 Tax=Pneumocystis carinii (strain B80) TaxID=1408658 RepID=A0A0W4ZAT7_PNEC8|nr:cytoplasmic tRNA 2-thiolation protein 1 [Pneumocystis carinii B80]KTW25572.1 cytoplasmic tRNA 2-thiolation protein 1 [Pneumocystis carinii B80]
MISKEASESIRSRKLCEICSLNYPSLKRPKTSQKLCKECFYYVFETEIHNTIISNSLFSRGDKIGIGASGGKDSTVLAYIMKILNDKYDYGLDLYMISVDEGIQGYRDDSLETVKRIQIQYSIPLKILSYEEIYGWSMDEIVKHVGRKNNCTFCGVFRRQALDRCAAMLNIDHIVTGHNADDIAETIIMNLLRGDISRLGRCTEILTGESKIKRSKPFKYTYEKEIVMYAHFKKLDYFSTECIYSSEAFRGFARALIKELESLRPSSIIDIIHSGEAFLLSDTVKKNLPTQKNCKKCGYMSSNDYCKACILLEGLNSKISRFGIEEIKKSMIIEIMRNSIKMINNQKHEEN